MPTACTLPTAPFRLPFPSATPTSFLNTPALMALTTHLVCHSTTVRKRSSLGKMKLGAAYKVRASSRATRELPAAKRKFPLTPMTPGLTAQDGLELTV